MTQTTIVLNPKRTEYGAEDAEELEDDEEEEEPEEDDGDDGFEDDGWINSGDFYHWDPFKGP